ncbi:hypothetical protein ACPV5L_12090 [Vibrio astriarenae]|jgi:hypothetical protein|uniref:hypothetical protein n=1 Tax=Vibrio agarivorans TaxID=153622 RepID=UPI0022305FCB|nr:hypothetical protein [Vibrio agarivorans]MDN3662542.1 hypothetical protein [Vibrio agarivorans]
MRKLTSLFCVLSCALSTTAWAVELPKLPANASASNHKIFVNSHSSQAYSQSMSLESGYAYSIFDNFDVYVGARLNEKDNGFLSGVSYSVSDRISVRGSLHSYKDVEQGERNETEQGLSAELTSRLRLSENIDVHATLDYQEWQSGVEVGLGFRF